MKPVLIYVRPLDQKTGARVDVRMADGPSADTFGTGGFVWEPAISVRPKLSIELASREMDGKVQAGQATFTLALGQVMTLPRAQQLYWKGAAVVIHTTGVLEGATAIPDFWGYVTAAQLDLETGRLSVTAEVSTALIDQPLLVGEFTGGGGILGDAGKRGVLWPVGFGAVNNIQPVWFDLVRNIGMIDGYGNTLSINWLGEGRSTFGPRVADYPSYAALAAAIDSKAIKPGQWGTCVAEGLVGLGAPATGVITVDAVFTRNRFGAIMKRILSRHAAVPGGRIDAAAFDSLDTLVPRPVHYWTDQQRNVKDLLEALAQSCNATPIVTFQNMVSVTRAVGGAIVGTLDRSGSIEPRVLDWQVADVDPPYYLLKARAVRPALVLSDDQVNYKDTLQDVGVYNGVTIYRAGNLVWLSDGSQWLYQNDTPSAGHAPPINATPDGNGFVQDAWWFRRQPPKTASDFKYADGTPIEALKPMEAGATVGMTAAEEQDYAAAKARIVAISSDAVLSAGSEKGDAELDWKAQHDDFDAIQARYVALGSPADITAARNQASNALASLDSYLAGLSPNWRDRTVDTPIVQSTWQQMWGNSLAAISLFRAAVTGRKGDPGQNAFTTYLTNADHTVPALFNGTVTSYAGAEGVFYIGIGNTDLTDSGQFALSITSNPQNLAIATSGRYFRIDGGLDPNEDSATVVFRLTGSGQYAGATIDQTFSLSKSKGGANGEAPRLLTLQATAQTVKYDTNNVMIPGQRISYTATLQNVPAGVIAAFEILNVDGNVVARGFASDYARGDFGAGYYESSASNQLTITSAGLAAILASHGGPPGKFAIRVTSSDVIFPNDSVGVQVVRDGAKGEPGPAGYNNATIPIYQRSGGGAPALPSAAATYTFASASLTGLNNGWVTSIPGGTDPVYASAATASSIGATDVINPGEWAAAQILAQNGASGVGTNGLNTKSLFIYQRAGGVPALPSANATYTFSSANLAGLNNGWSPTIPAGTMPIYVSTSTALSPTDTDNINPGEWAAAQILSQNGDNGKDGFSVIASPAAFIIPSTSGGGSKPVWTGGSCRIALIKGGVEVTADAYSYVAATNIASIALSGRNVTFADVIGDQGEFTARATLAGVNYDMRVTVTRARDGSAAFQSSQPFFANGPAVNGVGNTTAPAGRVMTISASADYLAKSDRQCTGTLSLYWRNITDGGASNYLGAVTGSESSNLNRGSASEPDYEGVYGYVTASFNFTAPSPDKQIEYTANFTTSQSGGGYVSGIVQLKGAA